MLLLGGEMVSGWTLRSWGLWSTGGRRGTYWVIITEDESEAVGLVLVEGVGVEHAEVHFPLLEVVGVDECDAVGQSLFYLFIVL